MRDDYSHKHEIDFHPKDRAKSRLDDRSQISMQKLNILDNS